MLNTKRGNEVAFGSGGAGEEQASPSCAGNKGRRRKAVGSASADNQSCASAASLMHDPAMEGQGLVE
jgi:hypothetical protein